MKTEPWTQARIQSLKDEGKIMGFKAQKKPITEARGKKVARHYRMADKAKDWIAWNLWAWCKERGVVLEEEYRFDPVRKWRADWAIPEPYKILVEYEGLMSEKSRHTTVGGYTKDAQKYNAAQALGWKVLRFTAINYRELITELNKTA